MKTEGERLVKLETQMDNIEAKVDELKNIMTDFIEKSDQKFANKWVERALSWGLYTIASVVLLSLMGLIFINSK